MTIKCKAAGSELQLEWPMLLQWPVDMCPVSVVSVRVNHVTHPWSLVTAYTTWLLSKTHQSNSLCFQIKDILIKKDQPLSMKHFSKIHQIWWDQKIFFYIHFHFHFISKLCYEWKWRSLCSNIPKTKQKYQVWQASNWLILTATVEVVLPTLKTKVIKSLLGTTSKKKNGKFNDIEINGGRGSSPKHYFKKHLNDDILKRGVGV